VILIISLYAVTSSIRF